MTKHIDSLDLDNVNGGIAKGGCIPPTTNRIPQFPRIDMPKMPKLDMPKFDPKQFFPQHWPFFHGF